MSNSLKKNRANTWLVCTHVNGKCHFVYIRHPGGRDKMFDYLKNKTKQNKTKISKIEQTQNKTKQNKAKNKSEQ